MILHDKKLIFVHIPRTAGSSLEHLLNGQDLWIKQPYEKHLTSTQLKNKYPKEWDNYFKFSFIRNPWDRMVSLYHLQYYKEINSFNDHSLKFFLENQVVPDWECPDQQCSAYLKEDIDFIGRYENLDHDMRYVLDKLEVKKRLPLVNKTDHKHYSEYYDGDTIELVAQRFKDDIDRFGYKFEG